MLTAPSFFGPLLVGTLVSLAWIAACVSGAWAPIRHRDFAGDVSGRRAGCKPAARFVVAGAALLVVLTLAMSWGPGAITPARMQRSFADLQQPLHPAATLARTLRPGRGQARSAHQLPAPRQHEHRVGDWACNVYVIVPQQGNPLPVEQTVTYDLSVPSNGCYKAESPPAFVGAQMRQVSPHHSVVNPLYTIYACFDPL